MQFSLLLTLFFKISLFTYQHQENFSEKKPLKGLVAMDNLALLNKTGEVENKLLEPNAHPEVYVAQVVFGIWKDLEPEEGVYNFAEIEQGLASIRAYNKKYPAKPIVAKLMVRSGKYSPDWVKKLSGGEFFMPDKRTPGRSQSYAKFWDKRYINAWRNLQKALAEKYDAEPLIAEIRVSSGSSQTDEPFVLPLEKENISALLKAGLTDENHKAALLSAFDDYTYWKQTPLDFTFNPYFSLNSKGFGVPDAQFTINVMRKWKKLMGNKGVIANHALTDNISNPAQNSPAALSVLNELVKLGNPIELQMYGPKENINTAIPFAIKKYHPTEIELWTSKAAGGLADMNLADLQKWAIAIEQH